MQLATDELAVYVYVVSVIENASCARTSAHTCTYNYNISCVYINRAGCHHVLIPSHSPAKPKAHPYLARATGRCPYVSISTYRTPLDHSCAGTLKIFQVRNSLEKKKLVGARKTRSGLPSLVGQGAGTRRKPDQHRRPRRKSQFNSILYVQVEKVTAGDTSQ
jgi:hypothetical protein